MLTLRGYFMLGGLLAFVALITALIVTRSQIERAKKDITRLEMLVSSRDDTIRALNARVVATSGIATTQAEAAAETCQGTGAELFERGRQIGLATCAAR